MEEEDLKDIMEEENLSNESNLTEQSPDLEENEAQMDINPPKSGNLLGVASKALIAKLLKKKIIFITIAVAIALFLLILISAILDSSKVNDYIYDEKVDKCETVTVIYKPYTNQAETSETMDLEEYVNGAVYAYTNNMPNTDVGTYNLYRALDIAIRTEAISNNCTITYRNFKVYSRRRREKATTPIERALSDTEGLVAVSKETKEIINAKVSSFCYSSSDSENYVIPQVPDFKIPNAWVNENITDDILKNCPCNTPNENLTQCYSKDGIWQHEDDSSGFNVYAAKYVLDTYGLDAEHLLSYFIGDFDYRTIINDDDTKESEEEKPQTSALCESFSLHSTTLSKEEFVRGVKNYKKDSSPGMILFQQNADKIYDISVRNGINPEFVVARAVREGFSPGGSTHNYWGVGCNNEGQGKDCKSYLNFDTAVAEYCVYLKTTYTDMNDLLKRYAYLGKYWYNPGNWGLGGCPYKDVVYPEGVPQRVKDACDPSSENECLIGGVGNCVSTTDDEQIRYGKWQLREMTEVRKDMWGLSEGDCSTNNGKCKIFKQGDPKWSSELLLNSPNNNTLGSAGCALTSVAIAMTCSGKLTDYDNFTPSTLNKALKPYATSGDMAWMNDNFQKVYNDLAPGFRCTSSRVSLSGSASDKISQIKNAKKDNNQVILWLSNAEHSSHFVVYSSANEENSTIETMDPAYGAMHVYHAGDFKEMNIFSY